MPGPALGRHEDRVDLLHDVDRAEQRAELDEAIEVRQGDAAELLAGVAPSTRAASRTSSSIDCIPASRISIMNGAQRQTSMMMIDCTRVLGEPDRIHGLARAGSPHQPVDHAEVGVHHHVLPAQRAGHRHDQKRRDEHRADDAAAGKAVIDQLGVEEPEQRARWQPRRR